MAMSCVRCGIAVDYHGNPITGDESQPLCYDCAESLQGEGSRVASVPVYCFINNEWMGDVAVIAVCGACGDVIGNHVSSNEDWAKHDIEREYHHWEYHRHMAERHNAASYWAEWVDNPSAHARIQELKQQAKEAQ